MTLAGTKPRSRGGAVRGAVLALLLTACGTPTDEGPVPGAVNLSADSLHFDALGLDSTVVAEVVTRSGLPIPAGVVWSSADGDIAEVTASGVVRPRGEGVTTITATAAPGVQSSIPVSVYQIARSLEITDRDLRLTAFTEIAYPRVEAEDRLGYRIRGRAFTWSSTDSAVVRVDVGGALTAVSNGTSMVSAATDGVADTIVVTVAQEPSRMTVTPAFNVLSAATETVDLRADVLDALGSVIEGLELVWSSTDGTVGTVSGQGAVTAQGEGFAGIVASHDSVQAVASLTVGDVTDWSSVGNWTTYQGDVAHSGFVPAFLDVQRFTESWRVTPRTGIHMNAVAVEGGTIAFTTNSIGAPRMVGVLATATGAEQWAVGLGPVQNVDPPALSGGTVFVATGFVGQSRLWALDAATGDTVFASPYLNTDGVYLGPVPHAGKVYMAGGTGSGLYRFDAFTGAQDWHLPLADFDLWTPALRGDDVLAFLGGDSPGLTIVDGVTGTATGHASDPGFQLSEPRMRTAPVVTESGRVVLTQDGRLLAFDPALATVWSLPHDVQNRFEGQLAVADGSIFVVNGRRLDVRSEVDGSPQWSWEPPEPYGLSGTVVVTRNLVFASGGSTLHAIHRGSRQPVWSFTHPAIGPITFGADGALYVVLEDTLVRIDLL